MSILVAKLDPKYRDLFTKDGGISNSDLLGVSFNKDVNIHYTDEVIDYLKTHNTCYYL